MIKRTLLVSAALPLIAAAAPAPKADPLAASFRAHVAFLADDLLEGRGIGSQGHEIAANYIAQHFARLGLQPAGDKGTWFQRVNFAESRFASERETAVMETGAGKTITLENGVGLVLSPGDLAGPESISGEMVFVGYGLQDKSQGIDDFAGLDLKGKYAVVLSGAPDGMNSEVAAHLARTSKGIAALQAGAVGLITVRTLKEAARLPWEKFAPRARLPRRVLHRLDALARATGETRSGFIARMALEGHQATP